MPHEKKRLTEATTGQHPPFWIPLTWANAHLKQARVEDRINNDVELNSLLRDVVELRDACGKTIKTELIGVPLAYSQVCLFKKFMKYEYLSF
jgi:hypothetical protein